MISSFGQCLHVAPLHCGKTGDEFVGVQFEGGKTGTGGISVNFQLFSDSVIQHLHGCDREFAG